MVKRESALSVHVLLSKPPHKRMPEVPGAHGSLSEALVLFCLVSPIPAAPRPNKAAAPSTEHIGMQLSRKAGSPAAADLSAKSPVSLQGDDP